MSEKDERPWIKLALDYFDNPKIDALSDTGQLLHIQLIMRAARLQSDGAVSVRAAKARGDAAFKELVAGELLLKVDATTYRMDLLSEFLRVRGNGQVWVSPIIVRRAAIPVSLRLEIYAADNYKCVNCGSPDDLSLDHIHPWSLGGSDDRENLRTMCRPCNSRKGAKVVEGHPAVLHGHKRVVPPPEVDRASQ